MDSANTSQVIFRQNSPELKIVRLNLTPNDEESRITSPVSAENISRLVLIDQEELKYMKDTYQILSDQLMESHQRNEILQKELDEVKTASKPNVLGLLDEQYLTFLELTKEKHDVMRQLAKAQDEAKYFKLMAAKYYQDGVTLQKNYDALLQSCDSIKHQISVYERTRDLLSRKMEEVACAQMELREPDQTPKNSEEFLNFGNFDLSLRSCQKSYLGALHEFLAKKSKDMEDEENLDNKIPFREDPITSVEPQEQMPIEKGFTFLV